MFSQRNLQGEGNLHSGTEVRVIRLGSKVAALPNTAKRFSPKPFERGRPWLRQTRALCKFNVGMEPSCGLRGQSRSRDTMVWVD